MKNYIKPEMTISLFKVENIITASGTVQSQLINKGENGEPMSDSFSSMFGN